MSRISFTLSICPQTIQLDNRIGRSKSGKAFMFSDKRKKDYLFLVWASANRYRPSQPFKGPLKMDLVFILPRPKAMMRKCDPDDLIPMPRKPDRDNLQKGTQDGLSASGFWLDDAQIFDGRVAKFYAEKGGQPRIIVTIEEVQL